MIADIISQGQNKSPVSLYQPTDEELERLKNVVRDYQIGYEIIHTAYDEFDGRTLVEVTREEKEEFDMVKPTLPNDTRQSWRSRDIKPLARAQMMDLAAQMTSKIIAPTIYAVNGDNQRDKDAESIISDIYEWNIENTDYEQRVVDAVFSFLLSRASIVNVEYLKVMQDILQDDGKTKQEIMDEILSGLHLLIVPVDELFITNPFERNMQKQRAILRRRLISYAEAEGMYSEMSNWTYVTPGVRCVYNGNDGLIYDVNDESFESTMVEEVIYYNRREDKQITYLNGVEMEVSRIKHRTMPGPEGITRPRYPYAKEFFAPTSNPKFFYGMSAISEVMPQADLVNKMHRLYIDGTYLATQPPLAKFGGGTFNKAVYVPGIVHNMADGTKMEALGPKVDPSFALEAAQEEERILKEAHSSNLISNTSDNLGRTAYEVAVLRERALVSLGLMGKQLSSLVSQIGELVLDTIVNHQTVGDVTALLSDDEVLTFPTFILPSQNKDGREVTKQIVFSSDLLGQEMTPEQRQEEEDRMASGLDEDTVLVKVNPELFSKLRYMIKIQPDIFVPQTEATRKLDKVNAYQIMIQNPYIDGQKVTRDFLVDSYTEGNPDDYMAKGNPIATMMQQQQQGQGQQGQQAPNAAQAPQQPSLSNLMPA